MFSIYTPWKHQNILPNIVNISEFYQNQVQKHVKHLRWSFYENS